MKPFLAAVLVSTASALPAQSTFVVDSTGDLPDANPGDGVCAAADGRCTLRAAIQEANADPAWDRIEFDLSGPDPLDPIVPRRPLEAVTAPLEIDGYSQAGALANTNPPELGSNAVVRVVLDGSVASAKHPASVTGLVVGADGCRIAGLAVHGFSGSGIQIRGFDNRVEGCFVGLDRSGSVPVGNGSHGIALLDGGDNVVGDVSPGSRNAISANGNDGVYVTRSRDNRILGNLIGTAADGLRALGNNNGISFGGGSGGTTSNEIGNGSPSGRNVVSGNRFVGISIGGSGASVVETKVRGNYVGTNATGTDAVPNGLYGLRLSRAAYTKVGGPTSLLGKGPGNVISGNGAAGVFLSTDTTHSNVQGNRIGTTADGSRALANGVGISCGATGVERNVILRNAISGNGVGVSLNGKLAVVDANWIGTDGSGNEVANTEGGIVVSGLRHRILSNTIAHNGGTAGVRIADGQGHSVLGNSIFDNAGLGIDIDPSGVNPNDPGDGDSGPNRLQNSLGLLWAVSRGSRTFVKMEFDHEPGRYVFEFFVSTGCDPTGFGEGEAFLGLLAPGLNTPGKKTFVARLPAAPAGAHLTATATNYYLGDTSEFSNCVVVGAPPVVSSTSTGAGSPR